MGGVSSQIQQKGIQSLKQMKAKVDSLPSSPITPEVLDRVLEEGKFRPKTDAILKTAKERQKDMSKDSVFQYVEQKDDAFISNLQSAMNDQVSSTIQKEEMPFKSSGILPTDRGSTPYVAQHVAGKLTSEEMKDLLTSTGMLSAPSGRQILAQQMELSNETVDTLLRYVAYPKLEKRRENTKELDALWPSWKKELSV